MNRRKKKKAYKKKYGHNPPKTEAKYYGKEWGKIVARAMDGIAEATRAIIPAIRKAVEDMARLARETVTRIQTMPEEEIISQAVETTTAYVVTDETLKQQLLQSIDKRGY